MRTCHKHNVTGIATYGDCPQCIKEQTPAMITNNTTPRTDAEQKWTFGDNRPGMSFECVKAEFAQELERELNKANTLWQYQKEETDKRIMQIRKLQKAFDDACAANKTYRQQELNHSPEYMAALLQDCEDKLAKATAALKAIFASTDPYADGAPDASAHDKLCNEVSSLARPWARTHSENAECTNPEGCQ